MSTTDDQAPKTLDEVLAAMPPEERAQAEAQLVEQVMRQPPFGHPTQWLLSRLNSPDGPAVLLELRSPGGGFRCVLPRNAALQMANEITKAAMSGPKLQIAQPGQVPGL